MRSKYLGIKAFIKNSINVFMPHSKYYWALRYWRRKYKEEGGQFYNSHYRKLMLAMADEADDSFMSGKIVADFGCGPRGSLIWIESAKKRIGIDVLADKYVKRFKLLDQPMTYVQSTENSIPLPNNYVDVIFTINAMDHVDSFEMMCKELIRILKSGGYFIGSFNLEEPATETEPQTLTEGIVKNHLLNHLRIESYRIANKGLGGNTYSNFFIPHQPNLSGPRYLWIKAKKPPTN